ncbi:MAG: metallophosphoesterase [Phycisphaerales bacterium]
MKRIMLLVAAFVAATLARTGVAHPPDASIAGHSRAWHDARTGSSVVGSFLFARSGKIGLETPDGDVVTMALDDLAPTDRAEAERRIAGIRALNEERVATALEQAAAGAAAPPQAAIFERFAPFVRTRFDDRWLYVESDGMAHEPLPFTMMVGIRNWQQQVPLPQPYVGANAWQIPLHPELADQPVSARTKLRRGAIALAANGIPIFNALNNRGEDAFAIGELDEYGGHCGRGDDYHYHAAPLAIEKIVGPGKPIAYALDGLAIYGLFDPTAKPGAPGACPLGGTDPLDELNGHFCDVAKGEGFGGGTRSYHYHASKTYPYINGGMRGKVTVDDTDQIVPQPHAQPVRPALGPLRGARIVGFRQTDTKAWSLRYSIDAKEYSINYRIGDDGRAQFEFVAPDAAPRTETYAPEQSRGDRPREPRRERDDRAPDAPSAPPPRRDADRPAPRDDGPPRLELRSGGLDASGQLDAKYTCDGAGVSPPFAWSNVPLEAKSLALTIHHVPPDGGERVYLVIYGIPADARGIAEAERTVGSFGLNSVNDRAEYAPPCSKGPGRKTYVATLYALSSAPTFDAARSVTRERLLAAIATTTLASATLELNYTRARGEGNPPGPRDERRQQQQQQQPKRGPEPQERGTLISRMTAFQTDVPPHDLDVVLVDPTPHSISATVVSARDCEGVIEWWRSGSSAVKRSDAVALHAGRVASIGMAGLEPDAEYRYRVVRTDPHGQVARGDEFAFHTQRGRSSPFTFTIQADSHLDANMDPHVYEQTLDNALADKPDFHIDLGDTFMTDKRREYREAAPQYDAQRWYFGRLCHSAPLFMVLGNHDGECGARRPGDDMGSWSYAMRVERFPPPTIGRDGMYTGRTALDRDGGANYYAFEWGDALFVVLDPFWPTTERPRGGAETEAGPTDESWKRTLGRPQYDWLARTLAGSTARYKFVFIHHLVGGFGKEARGGVEASPYFEWGGSNADGSPGFAEHRSGWPMPIHDLLVKEGVSAVFHGHDHLYVRNERDGIVYQCVPQPGNSLGGTRSAGDYGYRSGTTLGSPGHLRVRVGPEFATVDFVRAALDESDSRRRERESNGEVVASYRIAPRTSRDAH